MFLRFLELDVYGVFMGFEGLVFHFELLAIEALVLMVVIVVLAVGAWFFSE